MKKILIQYNYILHYRKAFFNELSKYYDVTVFHSGNPTLTEKDKYKEVIVPVKKVGPFFFQKGILEAVRSDQYDIVIALFDVRWVNTIFSIYFNKNSKFIWWGAWITKSKIANFIRLYFTKKSFANVFYTNEARLDFINYGIDDYNLYVANNTFDVGKRIKSYENQLKNTILFVGSLDKRKKNDVTINAFEKIINHIPQDINLIIIGDGSERKKLEQLVAELKIEERVFFKGKITSVDELQEYYKKAIVSVSFGQAGLSVLQSLGFGVPFLTKKNAISGGEITNVKHNINGILCDDEIESLEKHLKYLCNNVNHSRCLGKNAYQYYSDYCTIKNMVQGFLDAIDGTRIALVDEEK
ncbi:MAG: glycosyltransferase family 4 protein [Colwellia sp.]|nr:glycosyltransferase family 4 protein [Colwellia sp.]